MDDKTLGDIQTAQEAYAAALVPVGADLTAPRGKYLQVLYSNAIKQPDGSKVWQDTVEGDDGTAYIIHEERDNAGVTEHKQTVMGAGADAYKWLEHDWTPLAKVP